MRTALVTFPFVLLAACAHVAPIDADGNGEELTLLSWNVLHGANDKGELNLDSKGAYIAKHGADLVFLQEIDERCERSRSVDQMATLGELTGMEPSFGAFMPFQGGRYGLGMLSARPIESARELVLPEGDEPRVALLLEIEVSGTRILAVNVHFNWTRDDTSRFAQAEALLAELAKTDLPVIVAGDFNDQPASRTLQAFYAAGFSHVESAGASWSAREPRVDIDHILIRSGKRTRLESLGGSVIDESALSDHRPVKGRVRVVSSS